ncbi:HNH endonuclease signature motif containing protein [Sporichthya sp.]|uniref:HNH endonuclease signature motif containing protein n=1 Tax=Sporichthya sp. TaxID=65475 RepID=UPI00185A4548|nr:HNH endonuclease signature motif containing protein [Sporichthya sp.]MBA3742707.1 DUF222 domain-containing protein [Sporichthya sp.]
MSSAARLVAVLEVGLCAPDSGDTVTRMDAPDRWSADEVRAALAMSVAGAQKTLDLGWAVCRRLPELYQAMAFGELDEQRAWAIAHWTAELSDEHAHLICDEVLPHCLLSAAEPWVTGKVIAEIKKLAIALDPDWAERTYAEAIRRRRVVGWRNPDGSADLAGQQLEADRVAAACGRLKDLARKAKNGGDPRPIDQLRADLFTGMLDGTFEGLTAEQILEELAKTRPEPEPVVDDDAAEPLASDPAPDPAAEAAKEAAKEAADAAVREAARASARQSPRMGVQLRMKLSTLLGRDQHPADLAGWGPMDPVHARALAKQLSHGTWRFALADERGHLTLTGLCSVRPEGWRPRKAWAKGVLDLVFSAELLAEALEDPGTPAEWRPVLVHLIRSSAKLAELALRRRDRFEDDPALRAAESSRRFPREDLRRLLEMKLSTCIGVRCTNPAHGSEIDHTLDHGRGGPTVEENLAPACGHDHDLKTKGGWRLDRLDDSRFQWTTRLGRRYTVTTTPVIEQFAHPRQQPCPETDAA